MEMTYGYIVDTVKTMLQNLIHIIPPKHIE